MDQHNGNQGQNNGLIDTNLRLGLPQFHKDHQDPMPQHGRVCVECGEAGTPTWRRGPEGRGTLCNACGLKYMRKSKTGSTSEAAN